MGRKSCCAKQGLKRGAWSANEDDILVNYIHTHGEGKWRDLPQKAGLKRCGKSCRLRWLNYLRPDIKRGNISTEEEDLIIRMHKLLGNRWSLIAGRLPGRTDNEIKNYWNTNLSKRLQANKLKDFGKQHGNLEEIASMKNSSKSNVGQNPELNLQNLTDSHHRVIRTKAFRCKKVVIPCLLADDHQMVDKNIVSGLACETPSSSGLDNSNTDFLNDFDINDLLFSDVVLNSELCEPNKEINIINEELCDKEGENGLNKGVSCFHFPVDETNYLMDETIIRSENWRDTFEANHQVGMLELNAFSSFLNSPGLII